MAILKDFMFSIPTPFNMVVAVVFIVSILGVVKVVVAEIGKYAVRRRELDFKRDMVERGLEVDEIERLLRSGDYTGKHQASRWE